MGSTSALKITRMYCGDDGQSHFEDLWLPLEENTAHPDPRMVGRSIGFMAGFPAESVSFRVTPPGGDHPFHASPGRALQFTLSGMLELEVGDGSTLRLGPGDVLIIDEQGNGQGHISRELEPRLTLNVHLPVDLDLAPFRSPPA